MVESIDEISVVNLLKWNANAIICKNTPEFHYLEELLYVFVVIHAHLAPDVGITTTRVVNTNFPVGLENTYLH